MSKISQQRLAKFLQDAEQRKWPMKEEEWKQFFEVVETYGVESK